MVLSICGLQYTRVSSGMLRPSFWDEYLSDFSANTTLILDGDYPLLEKEGDKSLFLVKI
jgi:hypothetical protein